MRTFRQIISGPCRSSAALKSPGPRRGTPTTAEAVEVTVVRHLTRRVHHGRVPGTQVDISTVGFRTARREGLPALAHAMQLPKKALGPGVLDVQVTGKSRRPRTVHSSTPRTVTAPSEECQDARSVPSPVAVQPHGPRPKGIGITVADGAEDVRVHGPCRYAVHGHVLDGPQLRALPVTVTNHVLVAIKLDRTLALSIEFSATVVEANPGDVIGNAWLAVGATVAVELAVRVTAAH